MPTKELTEQQEFVDNYQEYLELQQKGLFNGKCSIDNMERVQNIHFDLTGDIDDEDIFNKSCNFMEIQNLSDRGKQYYYEALQEAFRLVQILFCPYDARQEMTPQLREALDITLNRTHEGEMDSYSVEALESDTMFWEVIEHFTAMLRSQPYDKTADFIKYAEYQVLVNKLKGIDPETQLEELKQEEYTI